MAHPSDSSAQRKAEQELIQGLSTRIQVQLKAEHLNVGSRVPIQIDGFSLEHRVLAEAFARIGDLKPAQTQKVLSDILKMLFIEKFQGGSWRKILVFADDITARTIKSSSWVAKAVTAFGIEVEIVSLSKPTRENILQAQELQKMINVVGGA